MGRKLMLTFDVGDEVVGLPKREKGRAGGDERRANDPTVGEASDCPSGIKAPIFNGSSRRQINSYL